ncbi:MAG: LETM1 domain-containing protein [Bacteroidota bacterium]
MNPGERGWLKPFIAHKKHALRIPAADPSLRLIRKVSDSYEFLYKLIQPTGLMYGHPISFIGTPHPLNLEWSEKDKIKVLLAEGYIMSGMYFHYDSDKEVIQTMEDVLTDIRNFYQHNYPLFASSSRSLFGKRTDTIDQIEYILDRRISIRYDWRNFWTSFFHNSLLFFDLILFVQWMEHPVAIPGETQKVRRHNLRLNLLRVIAAAAHADSEVQTEEKELFNYFLHSANLPQSEKKRAANFIVEGIKLDDLDLQDLHSWILKKYFLELAILTTWSNRSVSDKEEIFIRKLAHQLDLTLDDLEQSTLSVRKFVMACWDQVHYLQIKQNYRIVSERMLGRMRTIVKKNQRLVSQEIQESKELVTLLRKSRTQNLSPNEKEKVRDQLLDILRTIPTFAIFLLPFGSLTLPLLLKIIPKHVLYPSSFRENEI